MFFDIPRVGDTVAKDEVFGTVEAVKTVSDLFMPLSGEVLELNEQLDANPELVNQDPYGKGWMVKIHMTDASETRSEEHTSELQSLMRISYAVFCLKKKKYDNYN